MFNRPMKVSFPHSKSIVLCCTALHNFHLIDEESVIPSRWKTRRGPYEDRPEVGECGRYRNESSLTENSILKRLKADLKASGNDRTPVKVKDMAEQLVDYFVDKDISWLWSPAGVVPY